MSCPNVHNSARKDAEIADPCVAVCSWGAGAFEPKRHTTNGATTLQTLRSCGDNGDHTEDSADRPDDTVGQID
jgi:hypothetical protein